MHWSITVFGICRLVCLSFGITRVQLCKTADLIKIPFGVMSLRNRVFSVSQCIGTVVRSTSQSHGDSKISGGGSELPNPWTDWQKIGVDDYVGDDSPHAKIQNNRTIGGVGAWRRIYMRGISPSRGFSFPILSYRFCDPKFGSRPETKQ